MISEKQKSTPKGAKKAKKEVTLDCSDLFASFPAVKGYFCEFLVSNILVTSLSSDSDAACQRDTISKHLISFIVS